MKISLCYTLNRLNLLDFVNEGDTALRLASRVMADFYRVHLVSVSLILCSAI